MRTNTLKLLCAKSIDQVTNTKADVRTGIPVGSSNIAMEAHALAATNTPRTA
jgi:hypothetical protein